MAKPPKLPAASKPPAGMKLPPMEKAPKGMPIPPMGKAPGKMGGKPMISIAITIPKKGSKPPKK